MSDNLYALIVAAGSGSRMASSIPKQFLLLNGKPVLMHTIEAFHRYSSTLQILVVLPSLQIDYWQQLCDQYTFSIPHQVVAGGSSRTASVRNGLHAIGDDKGLVAIHDGVRPLIPQVVIDQSYQTAKERGNAVAAIQLKDSIRRVLADGRNLAEDRDQFRMIQTPQTFQLKMIKKAYASIAQGKILSDDASVIEACGHNIYMITGDYKNIKITTPEDLRIAEAFLAKAPDDNN